MSGPPTGACTTREKRFTVVPTPIAGVVLVKGQPHGDSRGAFMRLYCQDDLSEILGPRRIVQINHSRTQRVGTVRGMHFQRPPNAEMKLVRCLRGRVWDVAVDLRHGSPTFGRWFGADLTPENGLMLVVPEGCAHGFQVLETDSELLYLHTAAYAPEAEGGVASADPMLGIEWPLPPVELSPRDLAFPPLTPAFVGI